MDVIRHSWKYWKKIWPQVVLVVALALIMMSITLLTPQVSQLIIDKVLYPALGERRLYRHVRDAFVLFGRHDACIVRRALFALEPCARV